MMNKKLKRYILKCVIHEYYEVAAVSAKDAIEGDFCDPYRIDTKSVRVLGLAENRNAIGAKLP